MIDDSLSETIWSRFLKFHHHRRHVLNRFSILFSSLSSAYPSLASINSIVQKTGNFSS